jgi:hypothetical protein
MAVPTRPIANKFLETSNAGRSCLFFDGAHYGKSIAAKPNARMIMPLARR